MWKYALFVSFFPQLVAGPIERSSNLLPQFDEKHRFNTPMFIEGIKMMLFGYFMKLCIADNVSGYVDAVFNNMDFHNGTSLILATFFFTFQIFCDFGGYSLIAIGAAMCMGFRLMQNFRQPYLAVSPKNFWRRWHISLSSWFTEYVYIPLGGNRCSKGRRTFNTVATMLVSGLWHGANWTFVIWGAYHGVLVAICNIFPGKKNDEREARNRKFLSGLKKMGTEHGMLYNGNGMPSILMGLMLIGILMVIEIYRERRGTRQLPEHLSTGRLITDIAYSATLIIVILLCGSFTGGQFIYFQF